MSLLHELKNRQILYKYKDKVLDHLPFNNFEIDKQEIDGNITYISVSKRLPNYVHFIIVIILLVPIIFINSTSNKLHYYQKKVHYMRVPTEMYYESKTNSLDLDVTNDISNFETISIKLVDPNGDTVLNLTGIKPGESIGTIPIGDYKFESLPARCKLLYDSTCDGFRFDTIYKDILVVDRSVTDKELNNDF